MAKDDDPGAGGGSISERAANGEGAGDDDGEQPELFPMGSVEGDAKTLKTLIRAGQAVETTVSIGSAEVPLTGAGLMDPDKGGKLLVTYEVADYKEIPVREGTRADSNRRVKSWKVRTSLAAVHVERLIGDAAAIEAQFAALLDEDEKAAAALLDDLAARTKAKLNGGKHPARVPAGAST